MERGDRVPVRVVMGLRVGTADRVGEEDLTAVRVGVGDRVAVHVVRDVAVPAASDRRFPSTPISAIGIPRTPPPPAPTKHSNKRSNRILLWSIKQFLDGDTPYSSR